MAHVVLGRKDDAIRAARRAVQLVARSPKTPRTVRPSSRNLAAIYAWFGEVDAAVERFDRHLSVPAPESVRSILLDRLIDPVRDHPRFQALVEGYE